MSNPIERIRENWTAVVDQVREAEQHFGRRPHSVRIVGVSKYVDAATTRQLVDAGCRELGESRPQSLWDKADQMADVDCQWHMIGHLQRNKVRRTLPHVALVHSVDSVRLARAISEAAESLERPPVEGLIEVNVSEEPNKHGLAVEEVAGALEAIAVLPGIRIRGLMAMARYGATGDQARRDFATLRRIRDAIRGAGTPESIQLDELSMGMSGDFAEAIAEGATIVRVGSRLFEGIER